MAAVDAGLAVEKTIGDYKLITLGAKLRQLLRIEVVKPNSAKLQDDLHVARANYARRVEYLAAQGFLTIFDVSEFPANAPQAPAPDAPNGEAASSDSPLGRELTNYDSACAAVRAAEEAYDRAYRDPQSTGYVKALLALQEAKRVRAEAALAEVQSRRYSVRRIRYSDGAATVLPAPDALTKIYNEYLPEYDVVPDDTALRAGLPVYSWEAAYHAIL